MRSLDLCFAFCAALAAASACFATPAAAKGEPNTVWVVGTGEKNGRDVTVRWRDVAPDVQAKATHALCAVVTWHFSKDASGKVLVDELARAFDFETTLEQALEKHGLGIEAVSLTDDEKREWTYYVSDRDKAAAAIDALKQDDPGIPVSYEIHPDPDWQGLQEVLGAVKQ